MFSRNRNQEVPPRNYLRELAGNGSERAGAYLRLRCEMAVMGRTERMALLSSLVGEAISTGNAALRTIPEAAPERSERVELTLQASRNDPDFRHTVQRGDGARDKGDWDLGAVHYTRALAMYQYHHGYLVQRSHCLKEAGHYIEAEIGYRDALALGAPWNDVREHLAFAAVKTGFSNRTYPPGIAGRFEAADLVSDSCWRNQLSTSTDVQKLADLFYGEETRWSGWTRDHLRAAPMRADLVARLVRASEFRRVNRRLLRLLAKPDEQPR